MKFGFFVVNYLKFFFFKGGFYIYSFFFSLDGIIWTFFKGSLFFGLRIGSGVLGFGSSCSF